MKNKILKKFVTLILIIIIILMQAPVVHASLAGNAQAESGEIPPPETPPDDPIVPPTHVDPPTGEPTKGPDVIYETYYEAIEGNVYEDLGHILPGTNGGDDASQSTPAKGVIALLKSGDSIVDYKIIDESGSYSFTPRDGTYSTEFWYGNLDEKYINLQNKELVKSILKYNGHDYIATEVPSSQNYTSNKKISVEELEVKQSGKGAAQVFITLDCSYGMRTTLVTENGKTKTRLQIAAESAKQLINSLINANENIYVGLVFFSGTNYRAVSLTKNKEILYKALDEIVSNGWQTPNTNILGALDKAKESYYNNDKNNSNRYLILISDAIPTSDGSTQVYCNESESTTLNKLYNTIGPNTKKKVQELRKDGINIISLVTKSDELDETQYVEGIFKDTSNIYLSIRDGQEVIDTITKTIKEFLIEETKKQEKEYISGFTTLAGYEDKQRRADVDNNFGTFTYANTIIFEQIENYNGSTKSQDEAKKLSELTKMKVVGGSNYKISHKGDKPDYEEIKDKDGKVTTIIHRQSTKYTGQNLGLSARPAISLETKTTATGLEIILADGSIFDLQTKDVGSDLPIIKAIDDEITHGATIKVEYTIAIKNDSSIQCNYLEMINHLPPGFIYSSNLKLITENKKNSDYGFKDVSLQDLYNNGYISEETLNYAKNRKSIKVTLDNAGKGKNGFYIAPGGEYTLKFVTSKVISKLDDIEYMQDTIAEVLVYKDSSNRRMAYKINMNVGNPNSQLLHGVYPGDNKDKDCATFTNKVYIMPPFGESKNTVIKFITVGLAIILVGIILTIRKEGKKNKKHK